MANFQNKVAAASELLSQIIFESHTSFLQPQPHLFLVTEKRPYTNSYRHCKTAGVVQNVVRKTN